MLYHVLLTVVLRQISDFRLQALEYAYGFYAALVVWDTEGYRGATIVDNMFWDLTKFEQRVSNFGWEHPRAPQRYEDMANKVVELLELVKPVLGELKNLAPELSDYPIPSSIVYFLGKKVRELRDYLKVVGPFGSPS